MPCPTSPVRRRLIRIGLATPLALMLADRGGRPATAGRGGTRSLKLRHQHTGERAETTFFADGRHLEDGLAAANHLLRDWRENAACAIDPALLDLMWLLTRRLRYAATVEVVCGYRTPATNAWLARHNDGVDANSLHMSGMALDFRLPDCPLQVVRTAAVQLGLGGVGCYPRNDFIHVDTGPTRAWAG